MFTVGQRVGMTLHRRGRRCRFVRRLRGTVTTVHPDLVEVAWDGHRYPKVEAASTLYSLEKAYR